MMKPSERISNLVRELDKTLPRDWLWIAGDLHEFGVEVAQLEAQLMDAEQMSTERGEKRDILYKENDALRNLLKKASRFNVLSKTESAPAWDSDSPFQQEIDTLLTGEPDTTSLP